MSRRLFALLALAAIACASPEARAQIVSDFSVAGVVDGWTVGDQSGPGAVTVTHNSTNGNPGGYVSSVTISGQPHFWYAPSKFLGNRAYTSYGETLSFDVQTSTAAPEHSAVGDIMLSNGSLSMYLNVTGLPAQAPGWTHYSVKLDETSNWKANAIGGSTASREFVISVLSGLQTIRIFMQWKFAGSITGGLDNVVLGLRPPLAPRPVISSISPTKASPGTSVTITGTGFGATATDNIVYFGTVKGVIESASATQVVVKVPMSADYARLEVVNTTNSLSGTSYQYFVPTFATGGGATIIAGSFDKFTQYNRTLGWMTHADLNGDGKPEMIMSRDNFISVFENTSTTGVIDASSFGPRLDLTPSAAYGYAEIGADDLDNDGKIDIFVAIRDSPDQGRVVVLPNIHTSGPITAGSFGPFIDVTVPPYTTSAAHSADLDGDGKPELLSWGSSCGANPVYVLQNISEPGDIRFTSQISLAGQSTCGGRYQTTDLDGDGKIDIVQSGDNNTRIFRNTSVPGTLSFAAPFDMGDGAGLTSLGDLDNDGKPEIVFAQGGVKIYKNISTPGSLSVASFTTVTALTSGVTQAKIADLNGDGKPDIVAALFGSGLGVYQNVTPDGQINGGSFRPVVPINVGGDAASNIDVADFDFDGRPDLVSNNGGFSTVSVVRNAVSIAPTITSLSKKSGSPGSTITITGTNFHAMAANIHVWFGNAKGTISNATPTSLEVVVPIGASYDQVSVAMNGYTVFSKEFFTPTFGGGTEFNAGSFTIALERTIGNAGVVEVGDFDVDGKVDILADNFNAIGIHRNVGTTGVIDASTFAAVYNTGNSANVFKKGDFDGDGKLDLAVNHTASRNISNAASPNPIIFDTFIGRDNTNPTVGDFASFRDLNNDGKVDVAFAGLSAALAYAAQNQTRPGAFYDYTITPPSFGDHASFARPVTGGWCVVADFDGDGFNDMITTNPTNNTLSTFLNKQQPFPITSTLFNARVDIPAGTTPSGIVMADFDNDGKPDVAVTNSAASNATISIFRNTSVVGTMSFVRQDFPAANSPARIAAGDLDGDGRVDIVVTNQGTGTNSFSIFRNKMIGSTLDATSFSAKVDYSTVNSPRGLAVADVDGDMRPEVIITRVTSNILTVFKNLVPPGPNISFLKQPGNTTACENGSTSYSILAMGADNLTYTWQRFNTTTSLFEDLTASTNVSGVNTSTLVISNISASMNGSIYRCKVLGNGASEKISEQGTLTVSTSPAAPTTAGASACKGSSLTLTASGGADGNYRWYAAGSQQPINGEVNSSFATPVIFETTSFYAAIANTQGCVSAKTEAIATINPISKPTITSDGTMLCGVNVVKISGPAGFAVYNWSNGESTKDINVSFVGSYALIVQDANGCSSLASDPIVVTAGSVAKPVIEASKTRLCAAGDQLILSGPGGFAAYEWSTGATTPTLSVTTAGIYSLKVVNASGCRSESSDDFEVELGADKPTISVGTDVLVSSPAKSYQWYFGDVKIPEGTKQFLKYNPFQYGAFSVAVTDFADCASTSDVFVNLVTEAEHQELNNIVYPNPFTKVLVLNIDVEEAQLFDATGKAVITLVTGENDVSHLARGLYILRLRNGSEIKSVKVSK